MSDDAEKAEEEKPFILLGGVNTCAATPAELSSSYIEGNLKRGLPRLHDLPDWKRVKGPHVPIAIVGGGPSLEDYLDELRGFHTIVACGSVHDYLRKHGFKPRYTVVCDPDPIMANYLRDPWPETTYLVSSHSHESVYEALKQVPVAVWHCAPIDRDLLERIDPGWQAIGGGCTVGLRAISIALMIGYSNLHFFGFDSCLRDDAHHAYEFTDPENEHLGDIYTMKLGHEKEGPDKDSKVYRCAGYQMAQANHFQILLKEYGSFFNPTFHGTGLLPDMWDHINKLAERLLKEKEEAERAA